MEADYKGLCDIVAWDSPHTAGHHTLQDIHTRSCPTPRDTDPHSDTVGFHIYSSGFHSECPQNQEDTGSGNLSGLSVDENKF